MSGAPPGEGAGVVRPLRLGLVGHPIGASLSPPMHRAALALRGLDGSYERFDVVDEGALEELWERLRRGALDGLNATVPHKRRAAAACATLSPLAARLGAVNTLVADGHGGIAGWNTDLPGLVAAVRERWPALERRSIDGPTLVVGAGGAAPAAIMAAVELGASEVRVWNRSAARARELVATLGVGEACEDVGAAARGASLVLQASSHGMGLDGGAFEEAVAFAREVIAETAADARVVDLVYRPRPTAWVTAAARVRREACDGLGMLVHQAALAFELWTGARSEVLADSRAAAMLADAMRAAAKATLEREPSRPR